MRYGYLWSSAAILMISSLAGCASSPSETYYTLSAGVRGKWGEFCKRRVCIQHRGGAHHVAGGR